MTRLDPAVAAPPASVAPALRRVPAVVALFWIVKVLTTGMGETTSDFLVVRFAPEVVVPVAFLALVAALVVQARMRRYVPAVYWGAVLLVSVFGTMAADVVHVALGVPYAVSTAGFALALTALFVLWYRVERTLSVHAITTARREAFYWAAVLTTFALGTAAGDWTAKTLGLGYLASGLLFAGGIAVPAVLHRARVLGAVPAFWAAYVVTRPLGASFADWLGVEPARGGLGLGTGPVSLAALGVFVVLVAVLARTRVDDPNPHPRADRGAATTRPGRPL